MIRGRSVYLCLFTIFFMSIKLQGMSTSNNLPKITFIKTVDLCLNHKYEPQQIRITIDKTREGNNTQESSEEEVTYSSENRHLVFVDLRSPEEKLQLKLHSALETVLEQNLTTFKTLARMERVPLKATDTFHYFLQIKQTKSSDALEPTILQKNYILHSNGKQELVASSKPLFIKFKNIIQEQLLQTNDLKKD